MDKKVFKDGTSTSEGQIKPLDPAKKSSELQQKTQNLQQKLSKITENLEKLETQKEKVEKTNVQDSRLQPQIQRIEELSNAIKEVGNAREQPAGSLENLKEEQERLKSRQENLEQQIKEVQQEGSSLGSLKVLFEKTINFLANFDFSRDKDKSIEKFLSLIKGRNVKIGVSQEDIGILSEKMELVKILKDLSEFENKALEDKKGKSKMEKKN